MYFGIGIGWKVSVSVSVSKFGIGNSLTEHTRFQYVYLFVL